MGNVCEETKSSIFGAKSVRQFCADPYETFYILLPHDCIDALCNVIARIVDERGHGRVRVSEGMREGARKRGRGRWPGQIPNQVPSQIPSYVPSQGPRKRETD